MFLPMMLTLEPMLEKKCPYSAAMYPPPMMTMLAGRLVRPNTLSLVRYPTFSMFLIGGMVVRDPVQRKNCFAVIVSSATCRVYGATNSALEW